jgi:hypothetical protein
LPTTLIFDYPNPEALARYVRSGLVTGPRPATAPRDAAEETRLRGLLASIPLERFQQAGLMGVLTELAAGIPERAVPTVPPAVSTGPRVPIAIDEMSVEDLLKLAPGKSL